MSGRLSCSIKIFKELGSNVQTELIEDVLYGPARMIGGSRLEDDELIRLAREEFDGQPFCIVRNWMLLDILLPETEERDVRKRGLQPSVLLVHEAVFDSEGRIAARDRFITGFQKDLHGCFFESEDALYILSGRGFRKHVSLPAFQALNAYSKAR
ncbi:hypothetical protein EAH72_27345 [Pseudomonas caspiana]|nr:hypothetical protein [Pseudomonas caspiana]TPG91170.1 hypothetical protein EAH72_27345 [Pseudomonas caspiana]